MKFSVKLLRPKWNVDKVVEPVFLVPAPKNIGFSDVIFSSSRFFLFLLDFGVNC